VCAFHLGAGRDQVLLPTERVETLAQESGRRALVGACVCVSARMAMRNAGSCASEFTAQRARQARHAAVRIALAGRDQLPSNTQAAWHTTLSQHAACNANYR
jgi:hypothetical protein